MNKNHPSFVIASKLRLQAMFRFLFAIVFLFAFEYTAQGQSFEIIVPDIPGIEIIPGESVPIPGPETALAFQFGDGRIVVGQGKKSMWSTDGGHTWQLGPESPGEKVVIDLGDGEILAIKRNSRRRSDGLFTLKVRRSGDNWKTVQQDEAIVDIPNTSYTLTGGGDLIDGFLFHHGILKFPDGRLIGTMYGNYEGDTELCDGYPPELGQRKYRTVVVFSTDRGRTWGNHVQVAYNLMLGRGIPDDHPLAEHLPDERIKPTTAVPAITQEGFREADIVQAANGDLICVMRTGGRNGGTTTLFPTPLYCSRSTDMGKTWTLPYQIADRGVCPNLVTLANGIIVCTYSRPGNWLIFSDDDGKTWKGTFQFGTTRDYNYIVEVSPNIIQVYHETETKNRKLVRGTFFTINKR
jgi:hypothetical protein